MAKRDVQLVIKARSEADRAIDSITSAMRTLLGVQDDLSGSGERTSSTLDRIAGAFNNLETASNKINAAVAASERSLSQQGSALAENEARYAALRNEINAAEQAIVNTRLAMQTDGSPELAARLAAAQQAYRTLTGEAGRLQTKIAAQRGEVRASGEAFDGLKGAATAAQIAMGDMGDAGERESLKVAAAAREAEKALMDQAAAARQEVAARNAQSAINSQLGVDPDSGAGSARASAAVFEEDARAKRDAAAASDEMSAAAARLRARLNPTKAAQDALNAEIREAKTLYNAGKINIRELTAELNRLETELKQVDTAQGRVNRNGSNEIKGVLGLRPYELQNLSFQINDLFTQIASGAPVSQAFAQQGGQIAQIFPQLLNGVIKYAKGLGLLAVALTPVIIGFMRYNQVAKAQREFAGQLALSADGADLSTAALLDHVDALDNLGASYEDATDAINSFLKESVNPELIDSFSIAAQNLADITGIELTDAADQVAKAFANGYEELAEFDDNMNFLTLSEREQIRAMFDSGEASDARALAFARFFDKAQTGAEETETAWSRAMDAMGRAWSSFENFLAGTTVFEDLKKDINDVAVGAAFLFNMLNGQSTEEAGLNALGKRREEGTFNRRLGGLGFFLDDGQRTSAPTGPSGPPAGVDPLDTDSEREKKLESDRIFNENRRNRSHRGRARGGKTDADYQADFNREIERSNRNREIQAGYIATNNLLIGEALIAEQRRQAIAEALRDAEEKANKNSERRLTLSQEQRDEIARTTALEFDARNAKAVAQAKQEENEERINGILAQRQELIAALDFQNPEGRGADFIRAQIEGLDEELQGATQQALDFWNAIKEDDDALALLGMTLEEVIAIERGLQNQADRVRQDGLNRTKESVERGLSDLREMQSLLQEQIEFAQLNGESGRAGVLQEQLAEVNQRLTEGAEKAIEYWRAIRGNSEDLALMGLTAAEVDNIILGLENTIAAASELRTQFLKTGEALNRDLAQGGTDAIDSFARSIVNGENVLTSFANSFLQFAADFLIQIARMIAQQALFNALSGGAPGGGGGAGGLLSGLIGGLFHGGGVVGGTGGRGRAVSSAIFASAARYHRGGIAGLKPDEVPAILQRGEEVLTKADARHRNNGGKGGGAGGGTTQILAIGEEQIANAMAGTAGREVLLTRIRTDRATIRKELGID